MQTALLIVYIYAVLVAVGGLIGYLKAKSLPSLIMGSLSFLLLLAAGYGIGSGKGWGCGCAGAVSAGLFQSTVYENSRVHAGWPNGDFEYAYSCGDYADEKIKFIFGG